MALSRVTFTLTFTTTVAPNMYGLASCHSSCAQNFKMAPRVLESLCVPSLKCFLFCVSTKTQLLSLRNQKSSWLQLEKSQIATTHANISCNQSHIPTNAHNRFTNCTKVLNNSYMLGHQGPILRDSRMKRATSTNTSRNYLLTYLLHEAQSFLWS